MGCCSPEYRKVVADQEEKVNENSKETVPVWGKVASGVIIAGAIITFLLL